MARVANSVQLLLVLLAACCFHSSIAGPKRQQQGWRDGNGFKRDGNRYSSDAEGTEGTCGYESCTKSEKNMLNIHLVAHTHDDVGWLKTVDQYYYGSKTLIQKAGVQYIIDSVIESLLRNPDRKFIYVESAFFFKWWKEQTPELQEQVKELVNQGRLEFIGGAWSMNDEAATHYQSIVDQFTWGLRLLNDTFGECGRPKIGWQIDPFGHSREQASIFTQMGFDGLFFGRLDYEDKKLRMEKQTAEMIWKSSANLQESDLFTGVLYNLYQAPPGFCFDILCSDEPFIDSPLSAENNVDDKVDKFLFYIDQQAKHYRTNNILLTMGGDFTFMDANVYFKNLDKLIRYTNARQANGSNVNVFYSTPSCYLKALHEADITWPTKSDDFFPYASDNHSYWTGYFTSRPTVKRFERVGNHFLQVCKQLSALAPVKENHFNPHLNLLRDAMGVMQHHDAITGTQKQHVANDYDRMLHRAIKACGANTLVVLNQIVDPGQTKAHPRKLAHGIKRDFTFEFDTCHLLNISKCELTESKDSFMVTLYNPLAHSGYQYVRLPVTGNKYIVKDYRGIEITSQLVPIPGTLQNLNFRFSNASHELVFLASELPPLGYKSFFVTRVIETVDDMIHEPSVIMQADEPQHQWHSEEVTIGNKYLNISFDSNGFLSTIDANGISSRLRQTFVYYQGAIGNNYEARNRSSGAYIFRPNGTEKHVADTVQLHVVKGDVVQEVHQVFNDWISQVIRVYADENHVELEWLVGSIPVEDGVGKEIVSRFYTAAQSDGIFWTDSNGREMIKRVRNHRDTWELHLEEPIAGNYYPVTTKIALEDEKMRLAVLNDRAQGGASLEDGSLELMVHRRLLHDDSFGVDEALDERAYGKGLVARGKHYIMFGSKATSNPTLEARERFLQNQILLPNWVFLSDTTDVKYEEWQKRFNNIYSALSLSLPLNVNLMSFEPWKENSILVRFEHLLEKDEDPTYSKPVKFNLQDIFRSFSIEEVHETTLAGNQWKEENTRLKFKPDPEYLQHPSAEYPKHSNVVSGPADTVESLRNVNNDGYEIELAPMQIRTFVMELEYRP
ncbi:lysosomal alpha-mannosidase-like isoform X1 [Toxorhynchites rutilus septentrionalis]|uniref:lysosomal alpha-mannosidase-like isoform X1 n=1 Tax=Toxorhynchites rutilus septentrionalis TaxID=329112 RepID=UPI002478E287|nr:lysosomal alpha-mannosidase-like isoform X1 [Toxorhynchites rutilus septentrionalis]